MATLAQLEAESIHIMRSLRRPYRSRHRAVELAEHHRHLMALWHGLDERLGHSTVGASTDGSRRALRTQGSDGIQGLHT